jgi:voltage-gated potassium channel
MVAAVAFLLAYAVPIINPDLDPRGLYIFRLVAWGTWAMFVVDYVARLLLAEDRKRFFFRHLLDLAIIALPLLRSLRLLRLATLLAVLNRRASTNLRGRVAIYVAGGSALLAFCGSLAVLDAERANPEANIISFGDAVWWAITTMTTVGYGDSYPTTATGRLAAAALMLGGITLLGMVTATLASWLVEQVSVVDQQTEDLRAEIRQLSERLDLVLAQTPTSTEAQSRTTTHEKG